MNPLYLLIENFLGHRRTEVDCTQFESVLIVGKNKNNPYESNGTGKTTIFYAIDYALFGEYPSETVDEIIRDNCEECSVTFDFEMGQNIYRVVRSRRKKTKKSYIQLHQKINDKWKNISQKTATDTSNELARIVQINYNAFKNSVLFSQFDLNGLASNNPNERRDTLKEALGLAVYNKFEDISKKYIKDLRDKIKLQELKVSSYGSPKNDIQELDKKIENIKEDIKEKEEKRKVSQNRAKEKSSELHKLYTLLTSEIKNAKNSLAEIQQNKNKLLEKTKLLTEAINLDNNKINKLNISLDKDKKTLENLILQKEELDNKIFRDKTEIQWELEAALDGEINSKSVVRSLETKQVELNQPLPEGDICPHCKQKMSKTHREECGKRVAEETVIIQNEIKNNKQRLQSCAEKRQQAEKELNDIRAHDKLIVDAAAKILNYQHEIGNNEKYITRLQDIKKNAVSDLSNIFTTLSELSDKEAELSTILSSNVPADINQKIDLLKSETDRLEQVIEGLLTDISSSNAMVGVYSEKIKLRKDDEQKLEEEQKILDKFKTDLNIHKKVGFSFGSRGIPTMIIYTVLDDLQAEVNRFLSDLKPGLSLQFVILKDNADGESDDTLDIKFIVHGKERSYKILSGGQKFLFAVSLKLGLSMIIQKRLGVNIKFLELDEVDQSLDKAAVSTYADVIKKLQKHFKVFVITHNDGLQNKFTHAIMVEGDERNGAEAKLVTSWAN